MVCRLHGMSGSSKLSFPDTSEKEHLEGVKHDHFYEGLKEEYQVMLAHKMEDEWQAMYAELLKAVRQIEK